MAVGATFAGFRLTSLPPHREELDSSHSPDFGSAGLPAELIQARQDFYADVAVLAFPESDDGARLADVDEKALYVREPYTSKPGVKPYLPAMTGRVVQSVEISERFLWDLRLTAQELVIENHAQYLKQLGRHHGFGLSIAPYEMNPTSNMTLGGVADVPMCEFWSDGHGFDSTFSCFEATSIAHTLGCPIVAAEAFTAGSGEAWKLFPAAMKNQGDWAWCTGINRFVFHRFAHQPWLDRRPGMTMGPYGVHWDRTQTWWPMSGAQQCPCASRPTRVSLSCSGTS